MKTKQNRTLRIHRAFAVRKVWNRYAKIVWRTLSGQKPVDWLRN